MAMQRREFLNLGTLLAGGALLTSRVAFARTDERRARLVLIIMRGALDGLAAVPPYGDRDYAALRGEFALRAPGEARGRRPRRRASRFGPRATRGSRYVSGMRWPRMPSPPRTARAALRPWRPTRRPTRRGAP